MFVHDLHVQVDQPCLSMLKLVDYLLVQVGKPRYQPRHLLSVKYLVVLRNEIPFFQGKLF